MSVEAADLIAEAKALLSSQDSLAIRIEKVTEYAQRFDSWYAERSQEFSGESMHASAVELLELHNQLIVVAESWLKEAGMELGLHKKKGKGILAYADILPKRVSTYRGKKG